MFTAKRKNETTMPESCKIGPNRINYARGFQRIFVVLWFVYGVTLSSWLLHRSRGFVDGAKNRLATDTVEYKLCPLLPARLGMPVQTRSQCEAIWKEPIRKDEETLSIANEYFKQELKLLFALAGVIPLCLYQSIPALVDIGSKLYGWVYRGFDAAESPANPR